MALTIKRAGADEYGRHVKVLLTGDPGSGKTRLSSTFPDPLYANIEGGLMSVVDRQPAYIDVRSSTDLDMLRSALAQPPKAREQLLNVPVRSVIIDTLDSMQKILIAERLKEQHKEAMAMADWGWLGDMMRDIVRSFRNLDLHVVFCCHLRTVEDAETGQVLVKPSLQGQMGDEIPAYVDLAVLLRARPENKVVDGQNVRTLSRIMQTAPDARHPWLKDRSGKLPMEFPVDLTTDFSRINDLVFSSVAPPSTTETTIDVVPEAPPRTAPPKPDGKAKASKEAIQTLDQPVPEPVPVQAPADAPASTVERQLNGEQPGDLGSSRPENPAKAAKADVSHETAEQVPPSETVAVTDGTVPVQCENCGGPIESDDQLDLSRIRFRKPLCRTCFVAARSAKAR